MRNADRSASLEGLGLPTLGALRNRSSGVSSVSEWRLRLYSCSTQAWVARLSCESVRSTTPSSIAISRNSSVLQKRSCLPFCSGVCESVVQWRIPSFPRPSSVSPAVIAPPLSVSRPRGNPRFWIAWLRPWTSVSVSSLRYHWTWHPRRLWSSSMPSNQGFGQRPSLVTTEREHSWKSKCHRPCTCSTSNKRFSRATISSVERRRRRLRCLSSPRDFMKRQTVVYDGITPTLGSALTTTATLSKCS